MNNLSQHSVSLLAQRCLVSSSYWTLPEQPAKSCYCVSIDVHGKLIVTHNGLVVGNLMLGRDVIACKFSDAEDSVHRKDGEALSPMAYIVQLHTLEADICGMDAQTIEPTQLGRFTFQIANEIDSLTVYKKFIRTLGNYVKNCEPINNVASSALWTEAMLLPHYGHRAISPTMSQGVSINNPADEMPNLPGSSLLRSTHSPLRSNLDVREAQIKSFDTESDLTELSFDEIEGEENNSVLLNRYGLELRESDVSRLSSPSFLDDIMVTFGLELLQEHFRRSKNGNLQDICIDPYPCSSFRDYDYTGRTHPNPNDVFSKKYVIIPMREGLHCYLAVIMNPVRLLEPYSTDLSRRRYGTIYGFMPHQYSLSRGIMLYRPIGEDGDSENDKPLLQRIGKRKRKNKGERKGKKKVALGVTRQAVDPGQGTGRIRVGYSQYILAEGYVDDMGSSIVLEPPSITDLGEHHNDNVVPIQTRADTRHPDQVGTLLSPDCLEQPCVFVLDSRGDSRQEAIEELERFLEREAEAKKGIKLARRPLGMTARVPIQKDDHDCGLYLLHFACMLMNAPGYFCHALLSSVDWVWKASRVKTMRKRLVETIHQLSCAEDSWPCELAYPSAEDLDFNYPSTEVLGDRDEFTLQETDSEEEIPNTDTDNA